MNEITVDDVYEIAAEVAEETITKFLQNLVKLIPTSEEVVDDIKEAQYQELQNYRKNLKESTDRNIEVPQKKKPVITVDDLIDDSNEDFAGIAHPDKDSFEDSLNDMDDALSKITIPTSDLLGQSMNSPCD